MKINYSAIELLKEYSMIRIDHTMSNICRLIASNKNKIKKSKYWILRKTLKLFNKSNVCLDNINHVISIWNYSTKYNTLMTMFFHISSCIVKEFLDNVKYNAYLFNFYQIIIFNQTLLQLLYKLS